AEAQRAARHDRQDLREAFHRSRAQGYRRLLQDAGRQEDGRAGADRHQRKPQGGAGLGQPVLRRRAAALPRRDAEEGLQAVTVAVPSEVDLFVIGAGSGGVRAARIAAAHGAKVAIAEEYRVGGTCVIRGCVPKKLLVYASRFAHEFEDAAGFGWAVHHPPVDWATLIANKGKEIARLEAAYGATLGKAGVTILRKRAVLESAHDVRCGDERMRAGHILIATGGAPSYDETVPGIEHVISSNEAFHLPEMPRRILVHGGGYIAVEFAGIFAGLGARVTLVCRADNILRGFDDDVRRHLRIELEKRAIKVVSGSKVAKVEKVGGHYCVHLSGAAAGDVETVDRVMFATGRRPNVAGLGLEAAGVRIPANGRPPPPA